MHIIERINHIKHLIREAEIASGRQPGYVGLLAVSKGQSSQAIEEAYHAGLRDFGENYLQEAQTKMQALATLPLCWHFIGPIQSNKTAMIARLFSWVHSVSRLKIAELLNDARPTSMPPLNICLQVNFDNEETKAGVSPDALVELATAILQLPRLHLRGLMLIPKPLDNVSQQYDSFLRLSQMQNTVNQQLNTTMDTLSMGMSTDFQAAIYAGSTIVRLGTAIFGQRS